MTRIDPPMIRITYVGDCPTCGAENEKYMAPAADKAKTRIRLDCMDCGNTFLSSDARFEGVMTVY